MVIAHCRVSPASSDTFFILVFPLFPYSKENIIVIKGVEVQNKF